MLLQLGTGLKGHPICFFSIRVTEGDNIAEATECLEECGWGADVLSSEWTMKQTRQQPARQVQ